MSAQPALDLDDDLAPPRAVISSSPWAEAYASAKIAPVKLDEMITALDEFASRESASQRALVTAGFRVDCYAPTVRQIVALDTAMEVLAAIANAPDLARSVSKAVAAKRKEFGA